MLTMFSICMTKCVRSHSPSMLSIHLALSTCPCIHTYLQRVVELSKQYLPQLSCGLSDSRVHVHYQDGAEFMAQHRNKFDVIITDSSDPVGMRANDIDNLFFLLLGGCACQYVSAQFNEMTTPEHLPYYVYIHVVLYLNYSSSCLRD